MQSATHHRKFSSLTIAITGLLTMTLGIATGLTISNPVRIVTSETNNTRYTLINNSCTSKECLFDAAEEGVIGTTRITGYYTLIKEDYYDRPVECPGFVITGGSEALIQMLLNHINYGNTVNSKNTHQEPIVKVNLSTMSPEQSDTLLNSTRDTPVTFNIFRRMPPGKGAGECEAVLDFLTAVPTV